MKNLFKVTFVALMAAVMVSCGGASKEDFVGQWTPDLSSIDIHLSEDIPADLKKNVDVDDIKSEAKEGQKEADKMIIDFKEDGSVTLGPEGDTKDFKWNVDGDELIISGKMDEGPVKGKDFELAFEIVESGADAFTLKLTAMSLKEQIEAQFKEEMDEAMAQAGPILDMLNDDILTDTWASISFKKKEAES
ncbi:hypothetical protein [Parvicella tangerina]|uniref:Lipocalin-like domain-containing protein n=1 Tax=Parvicella tangerina TaxID=2829795 RepID=A0A916JP22_9FLAO|nr:hypothetical protein [Parvicella tangerina]CAG5085071.1 hypothetical protein CRYO30217_02642 [Parvicella tangerina]